MGTMAFREVVGGVYAYATCFSACFFIDGYNIKHVLVPRIKPVFQGVRLKCYIAILLHSHKRQTKYNYFFQQPKLLC